MMLALSPHEHSGRRLPHRHTSYGCLALVLTLVGAVIAAITLGVVAPGSADSGSIAVTGIVPGPPPSSAPTITTPASGTTNNSSITVRGLCNGGYTIVVTDNQAAQGSAFCGPDGTFSALLTLAVGGNQIATHYVDTLNQSGPSSVAVLVVYQPSSTQSAVPATAAPGVAGTTIAGSSQGGVGGQVLTITAPSLLSAVQVGSSFSLTGDIEGGMPPYALEVEWGDSTQTLLSRASAGSFTVEHTYRKAGQCVVLLRVSDVAGLSAVFQTTVAITGGQAAAPSSPAPPAVVTSPYELTVIWPLFIGICLVVGGFWLGERYDHRRWKSTLSQSPPAPST